MTQEIDFVKLSPTQNMTVLVKTLYPLEQHAEIADKLMSYDNIHAEQVGFIQKNLHPSAEAYLQMAGGEFCGNACMSLAVMLAMEKNLEEMNTVPILLETSGMNELVQCNVTRKEGRYYCKVAMPLPESIRARELYNGESIRQAVQLNYHDAIHLIIEVQQLDTSLQIEMECLIQNLAAKENVSLVGLLLYHPDSGEMAPLICVPGLNSMVWERGCGSGTASLGAYLAWKYQKNITAAVKQPGGIIHVNADYQHHLLNAIEIEGNVGIVAQGKAFINT